MEFLTAHSKVSTSHFGTDACLDNACPLTNTGLRRKSNLFSVKVCSLHAHAGPTRNANAVIMISQLLTCSVFSLQFSTK